jgi:hypothetical protein
VDCRGLWFDGEYFWTTESIDAALGNIYRFDRDGTIIREWLAPAFRGWGVCVVSGSPFRLRVEQTALSWNETLGACSYDVVTGDLRTLRDAGGYFVPSVNQCLADNITALALDFVDEPTPGEGHWILVRGVSVSGSMSYDTGTESQIASRGDGIDAATNSCP